MPTGPAQFANSALQCLKLPVGEADPQWDLGGGSAH